MNILDKNLLILASAGSGKTFQLSNRIIGLICKGSEPQKIVALTFTRKAAGEFADSILNKLAGAALDDEKAERLRSDIQLPEADIHDSLVRLTRSLHEVTLGTMDSFFSKVVRGFQYELGLTGGRFELIEGPQAEAITDEMLSNILSEVIENTEGEEFSHAFRRATIGKEEQSIHRTLREFVQKWHWVYREFPDDQWGPDELSPTDPAVWEKEKHALATVALDGISEIEFTDKRQRKALESLIQRFIEHTIGSGILGEKSDSKLFLSLIEQATTDHDGPLELQLYKPFTVLGDAADALRKLIQIAAKCEFAAALQRTRAIRQVVESYDQLCANQLRSKGRLGFNDVKLLMGQWAKSEDARLRREAVDFRLDARIDHWLLDEFQDTSRADWNGLFPLIDEAATNEEGTLFVVGDRKQAIYAWRGGDVSLFDEVLNRYHGNLETAPLDESWRSCPEVLDLVNRVCGNRSHMRELFGDAANSWHWHDHTSAEPIAAPDRKGHAKVEVVKGWEARLERTVEILKELKVGEREMSCGILLRGNKHAREVADFLKAHDFDVILEGAREPASDSTIGIVISHMLKWLMNPADGFAWNTLVMSPFHSALNQLFGSDAEEIWENLTASIATLGLHDSMKSVVATACPTLSEFGQSRANDILKAMSGLDQHGYSSLQQAVDHIERLKIPQSPGSAAVQVMTIHKSKGLGFDAVILPEIPTTKIPEANRYDMAKGKGWISETPAQWAREFFPDLQDNERRWGDHQMYEAFCTLYVAMTRAKRGLHVLLDPSKTEIDDPSHPSLSNWLARSLPDLEEVAYENGSEGWSHDLDLIRDITGDSKQATLNSANTTPVHKTNPSHKSSHRSGDQAALLFGTHVHELLEKITWLDDAAPSLPKSRAGDAVQSVIDCPKFDSVFSKKNRSIRLLREQDVDVLNNEQKISGVIDRLHLHLDPEGKVETVEIIDFKTDNSPVDQIVAKYRSQLGLYRDCISQIYPSIPVSCKLLLTHHLELVEV